MRRYKLMFDKKFKKRVIKIPKSFHMDIALKLEKLKEFEKAIKILDIKKLK